MNRYSLIFAMLVATSFAVHPTQAGDGGSSASTQADGGDKAKAGQTLLGGGSGAGSYVDDPVPFIQSFLKKAAPDPKQTQAVQVLFATVPHPVETQLAAAFDHNVEGLEDGLQDAGYLFDSSLIPWHRHSTRDQFDDDGKEKLAKQQEDELPGVLLFRKHNTSEEPGNPYGNGLIVFLLTEKPTGGIARVQEQSAVKILAHCGVSLDQQLRILGPSYSGSFASLVPIVSDLLDAGPTVEKVFIRSGSVTVSDAAKVAVARLDALSPKVAVDFGSAFHDYRDEIFLAQSTFRRMGIGDEQIALLSEGESLYGSKQARDEDRVNRLADTARLWKIAFPRDISALRADYQRQGVFNTSSPSQLGKRYLNLKSDEENEGDSVRSFGRADTVAAQESVLFGISEFVKAHSIHAVIIVATNEEDRYFLTQFLHANNAGVRVAILSATRLFMRGSTAQFRGDMMVDDLPMLPRLHDWTATENDHSERIFADDGSQGIYLAAIDLFGEPREFDHKYKWYSEYSEPNWDSAVTPVQRPPMYVVALGSNSTWPVSEWESRPARNGVHDSSGVEMPFTLFQHGTAIQQEAPSLARQIHVGFFWMVLFGLVIFLTLFYCGCFWYANPVSRIVFASFAPSPAWRFWLFKALVPAAIAGCAFRVLAWAVEMPLNASPQCVSLWRLAEVFTVLAPLAIAGSALLKALLVVKLAPRNWMWASFLPAAVAAVCLLFSRIFSGDPFAHRDLGSILNTYREMHWESGLSLIPTLMLFVVAIGVWASQAGSGAVLLDSAPPLPRYPGNARISRKRAQYIACVGRPMPDFTKTRWLWSMWVCLAGIILLAHFLFPPFQQITTLESHGMTFMVRSFSAVIIVLLVVDLLHFISLWEALKGLLRALDRQEFKRSFVPINDFKWKDLWSITGISFQDRRAIDAALSDCVADLAGKYQVPGFQWTAARLDELRYRYNSVHLPSVTARQFNRDRLRFFALISNAAAKAALLLTDPTHLDAEPRIKISADTEAIQRALACQCKGDGGRFSDEAEELARLPGQQQTAERLLCLLYIGFIQTIIARLHTLLIAVASLFSLLTLGITIYPFVPFSPLLLAGIALLLLVAWGFFKVFKEMDTDPILSRIVNGDDRKLQGNFYWKFGESLALPLLTLGSSILPGGAGRLLEMAQAFVNHAQ